MGEAKRRQAKRPTMRDVFEQAEGVLKGEILRKGRIRFDSAEFRNIADWTRMLISKPAELPLCLLCDTEFEVLKRFPEAFFRLVPHTEARERATSISGICAQCARKSDDELLNLSLDQVRKTYFPDATDIRILENVHEKPGNA
jgi:hypothetical protein